MPAMYLAIKNANKRKGMSDKTAKKKAAKTYIARSANPSAAAKALKSDKYKGK